MHWLHLKKNKITLQLKVSSYTPEEVCHCKCQAHILWFRHMLSTSTISNALQLKYYCGKELHTNSNDCTLMVTLVHAVGDTFDQYKISYNLLCIIIVIMQEVYITCPVFISTLIIYVKRDLPCFTECCCGPG